MSMKECDILIVGAGPAGVTAALYAARGRMNTVIVDRSGMGGGQLLNTELVENYPGIRSISGHDLARQMEEQARDFGATIEYGNVVEIWSDGEARYARIEDGDLYRAGAIILASGGSPRRLKVPGEKALAGMGVSYCALCDGAFFKDQVVAVVGGGDSAIEEAMYLTRFASKVYIVHRRDQWRAQKVLQEQALANPKIVPVWNSVPEEIGGENAVEWVRIRNVLDGTVTTLPVGGVFIYVGFEPNNELFRDPVKRDEGGFILTDQRMETSIPGVFAVGDLRSQYVRQITTAVGDATTAAVAATRFVEAWEHSHRAAPATR